jgi:hypothetical protein
VRSWPLLVLAAPAAAEVFSGWVGIAKMTGFGRVSPLPGIWPSLHLDTAITLPVGVEAYAAYALRAWLARDQGISGRTRRFAKWSAIFSFAPGRSLYHLMAQAGVAWAPWPVTTVVSCLPVLVLGMGTALAHMLRAAAEALDAPPGMAGRPAVLRSVSWSLADQAGPDRKRPEADRDRPAGQGQDGPGSGPRYGRRSAGPGPRPARSQVDQARTVARRLAAAGRPVSRRALRDGGVTGSNQALNALAHAQHRAGRAGRQRVDRRQAGWPASQDSIGPSHGGAPGIAAAPAPPGRAAGAAPPAQRPVPVVRGRPGQPLQRRGLQLADTLTADAEGRGLGPAGWTVRRLAGG